MTVHLRSFVEDLLAQVVGTQLEGDRQVYFHFLGLCGIVLTIVCGQLAVGQWNDSLAIIATIEGQVSWVIRYQLCVLLTGLDVALAA